MPRKRMLDPILWDDPDLTLLKPVERLLFIGMISLADDYGHISGHPAQLRKWVFGYDDVSIAEVKEMRDHILATCHNVQAYAIEGQEYIWLRNWERHQDLRFRAKAQYPCHACGEWHDSTDYQDCLGQPVDSRYLHVDTTQPLRISAQDVAHICSPDYVESCRDKLSNVRTEVAPNGAARPRPKKPRPDYGADFEAFWTEYPLKKGKTEAEKAYQRARQRGAAADVILVGAKNYAVACRSQGTEPRYICYAKTFLNNDRWNDYRQPVLVGPNKVPINGANKERPGYMTAEEAEIAFPDYA